MKKKMKHKNGNLKHKRKNKQPKWSITEINQDLQNKGTWGILELEAWDREDLAWVFS